ncbi:hypothetical protein AVEN_244361-1 [Araneus ventricosus]|uniref:Uncharacterized protein n=1 Tax=Araneus ventricosus TaxID=182803 RepID=A0A4Y2INB5_ARAVE|nr:hypothetical protein AVEN_244361-1 [Araneus ventricosus]
MSGEPKPNPIKDLPCMWFEYMLNLTSSGKASGVAWKFGDDGVESSGHCSKLRCPFQNSFPLASKMDVNVSNTSVPKLNVGS